MNLFQMAGIRMPEEGEKEEAAKPKQRKSPEKEKRPEGRGEGERREGPVKEWEKESA